MTNKIMLKKSEEYLKLRNRYVFLQQSKKNK